MFRGYVLGQIALWSLALTLPHPAGGYVATIAGTVGVIAFVVCVVWLRPDRLVAWWLVAASSLTLLAAGILTARRYGLATVVAESLPVPLTLVGLSLLVLAAGLAALGRRRDKAAGVADVLDATMVAAGATLLAWTFTADVGNTPIREPRVLFVIVLPIGAVLVFATAIKLKLSAGRHVPAITILVLAAVALVGASLDVVIPTTDGLALINSRFTRLLWAAHGTLLGTAALHTSFAHATRGIEWGAMSLSPWRIVLFAVTAVIVPLALAVGLTHEPHRLSRGVAGIAVPAASAAVLLLALVSRLALMARLSQRRASELARRSAELTAAMARQEELRGELAYRAMHDPLTGLSNRLVLAERLAAAFSRGSAWPQPALLLLDLDGFKDINDTYGHPIGDGLLSKVSQRLQACVSDDALVARLGGDEFAVFAEEISPAEARMRAEVVLRAIRRPYYVDDNELYLSASIGMLIVDPADPPLSPSEALRDVDLALYAAKNLGKNQVVEFKSGLRSERQERTRISAGLQRALAHGELYLDYQPIIYLATGGIFAVEALARWQPAGSPPIPPAQFIPIAEATGLISALGAQVLHQACLDARRWQQDHGAAVAVNVSGQQLRDPGFIDMVLGVLAEHDMPGSALILELTEDSLVRTSPQARESTQLDQLRERGVRIAIDDFGTGYSSLAYLSELPADIVKLDLSLTQGHRPATGGPNWAFTAAILEAIASVGLDAVAEGVETPEQARALRALPCPYAQGYLFSPPVPLGQIEQALTQQPDGATSGDPRTGRPGL